MKDTTIFFNLMHYDYTDDFFDYLISKGHKVLSVHYGYYNEYDLIEWEC